MKPYTLVAEKENTFWGDQKETIKHIQNYPLLNALIKILHVSKILCAKNSFSRMPQTWNLYNFSINGFVYIFIAYLFIFYITHVLVVYLGISLFKP